MADLKPTGEKIGPWTRLSTKPIYENPWIRVREDQVLRPDGSPGIYGVVHFRHVAVAVVPVDAEGRVVMVGQYRYSLRYYSWEIPEGGCPEGEDPFDAAIRELKEETGLAAARWDYLGSSALSNSATDEVGHIWLARDLSEGEAEPDPTEQIAVRRMGWDEALELAMTADRADALTVMGLFRARRFLDREGA